MVVLPFDAVIVTPGMPIVHECVVTMPVANYNGLLVRVFGAYEARLRNLTNPKRELG